jgi:hypothetical protein
MNNLNIQPWSKTALQNLQNVSFDIKKMQRSIFGYIENMEILAMMDKRDAAFLENTAKILKRVDNFRILYLSEGIKGFTGVFKEKEIYMYIEILTSANEHLNNKLVSKYVSLAQDIIRIANSATSNINTEIKHKQIGLTINSYISKFKYDKTMNYYNNEKDKHVHNIRRAERLEHIRDIPKVVDLAINFLKEVNAKFIELGKKLGPHLVTKAMVDNLPLQTPYIGHGIRDLIRKHTDEINDDIKGGRKNRRTSRRKYRNPSQRYKCTCDKGPL